MARQFDFNLLQTLEVLLAERNVTHAAARLRTSQPAVSAQLVRLREMFNDPLLIAGARGMTPTPRALELAPRLSELINGFRNIVYPETFDPATAQATILVGASDAAQFRVVHWFARLAVAAPGIKIGFIPETRIVTQDLETNMATGQIDINISVRSTFSDRLHVRFLGKEEFVCVMRCDHPFTKRMLSAEDFVSMEHVIVSPPGGDFTSNTDIALQEMSLRRNVVVSVPSFLMAEQILRNTDFAAVMPASMSRDLAATLKSYPLPFTIPAVELCMAWHERTHMSPVHRWVRDQISDEFKKNSLSAKEKLLAQG
jgi:DNA-binding transcriptional LysR family regulator